MLFEPRRWWDSPFDVEQLAWRSVTMAVDAAQGLAEARQSDARFGTNPASVSASFAAIEHLRVQGRAAEAWAPLSGFFPTADAWVRLHANYPHHAAAISRTFGLTEREEVARAMGGRTALEIEEMITREHGVAVAVRSPQQWDAHPQAVATANEPWVVQEQHGERPALSPVSHSSPRSVLQGLRVLDLTRVISGPTCSQLLACLGADVLRIDPPHRPELLDQYLSNGMGKRSAVIDLTICRDELEDLLSGADIVLLGYRPGSLARFGLEPDDLAERHPRLIVASLSAWGERGPWAQRPGFDSIVQAACGVAFESGDGSRPGALPVQALDHATGYVLAAHVMQLLRSNRAGIIRASLLGAARTLRRYPDPPAKAPARMTVATVDAQSPYGHLSLVPPPLTINHRTTERPIGKYGSSSLSWNAQN